MSADSMFGEITYEDWKHLPICQQCGAVTMATSISLEALPPLFGLCPECERRDFRRGFAAEQKTLGVPEAARQSWMFEQRMLLHEQDRDTMKLFYWHEITEHLEHPSFLEAVGDERPDEWEALEAKRMTNEGLTLEEAERWYEIKAFRREGGA